MLSRFRTLLLAVLLIAPLFMASPSQAQPAPLTIDAVSTMLSNMGYDPKSNSSGKSFSIVAHGRFDLTVTFNQSSPGGEVLAYVYLQKYSPDQYAKLDKEALLISDDSNVSYFSLARDKDDMMLYVQRTLPAVAVTPTVVRASLENLIKVTQDTEQVWNWRIWK